MILGSNKNCLSILTCSKEKKNCDSDNKNVRIALAVATTQVSEEMVMVITKLRSKLRNKILINLIKFNFKELKIIIILLIPLVDNVKFLKNGKHNYSNKS